MRRASVDGLVGLLLLLPAGCGGDGLALVPVSGRAVVNGQPLTAGSVSFRPDAAKGNTSAHHPTGAIAADGRFELSTAGRPGAPVGHYKVLVFANANATAGTAAHPKPPVWLTDRKYTSEATTDLRVEVVVSPEPGRYDLKLTK